MVYKWRVYPQKCRSCSRLKLTVQMAILIKWPLKFWVLCVLVCLHNFLSNSGLKLSKRPDLIHGNQKYILALIKTEIKLLINKNNCLLCGELGHLHHRSTRSHETRLAVIDWFGIQFRLKIVIRQLVV